MSHYTCLVAGEDPEAMLLPFDENLDVDEYKDYEPADPTEHWAYGTLVEKGRIADGAGWPELAAACNELYGDTDGDPILIEEGTGRAYTLSTRNPRGRWDWYQLGGRWRGFWMLKSDLTYPEDVVRAELHYAEDPATPIDRQYADAARKADIDFLGMAALAEAEAVSVHAQVREVLRGTGPPLSFTHFREMYAAEGESVIQRAMASAAADTAAAPAVVQRAALDMARAAYWSQPAVKALQEAHLMPFGDAVETFCLDEVDPAEAYADRARRNRVRTHALLTAEGWAESGRMGWFATVSDEDPDYERVFDRVLDAFPDHTLLSLYDLHT